MTALKISYNIAVNLYEIGADAMTSHDITQ